MVALKELHGMMSDGWPVGEAGGSPMVPMQVWIDASYMASVVYEFCRQSGRRYRSAVGRGAVQQHRQ